MSGDAFIPMSEPQSIRTFQYPEYRGVTLSWLLILLLSPIAGLLWNVHWGWLKANWILYPLIFAALFHAMRRSKREPKRFLLAILAGVFYLIYFFWNHGEAENVVRTGLALLPLLLLRPLREHLTDKTFTLFWVGYLVVLTVPLVLSILQIAGVIPYYEMDMAYGLYQGRISGGYQKVNNLNAFFLPAFLYAHYLFFKGRKTAGLILGSMVFVMVLISGLRTSVIAYSVILMCAFAPGFFTRIIGKGFRYGVMMVVGIGSFFLLSQMRERIGLVEGLRARIPMWEIHAEAFFGSPLQDILLGKGEVQLPPSAAEHKIYSLDEVHNNDYRMMITFGIVGYLMYGLLLRHLATRIVDSPGSDQFKFIQMAGIIYLLCYSVTNEPVFYPAILWSVTVWLIFPFDPVPADEKTNFVK